MWHFPQESEFQGQKFGLKRSIIVVAISIVISGFMIWGVEKTWVLKLIAPALTWLLILGSFGLAGCVVSGFPYRRMVSASGWIKTVVFVLIFLGLACSSSTITRSHKFVQILNQYDHDREDYEQWKIENDVDDN